MEEHCLAAAIEHRYYFRWCHYRELDTSHGLWARKDVALGIGATSVGLGFETQHYGKFRHPRFQDLAEFLGNYLTALALDTGRR